MINIPMLLLATLVVLMFCLSGIAIYHANLWLVILFIILGFILMGVGIAIKRTQQ